MNGTMPRLVLFVSAIAIGVRTASADCMPLEGQTLVAADSAAGDFFGYRIAVDGDTMVVGAPWDDNANGSDAGAAYVFVHTGGVWTQQAKLLASDGGTLDLFGGSVALSGDTAVVGFYFGGRDDAGGAYVFVRTGTVWSQQVKLVASDGAENDNFGSAVAVAGDTAVIGAALDDHPGHGNAGSAYIFVRAGSTWAEQAKLIGEDVAANDYFGISVAVMDDTALVGSVLDDNPGGANAGSAYVFVRAGGVWTQQAKLMAADAGTDGFGVSVGLAPNMAVIGEEHTAFATNPGSVYVFVRSGSDWSQEAKLTALDGIGGDGLGSSVAVSADLVLAGAPNADLAGAHNTGAAYLFRRSGGGWSQWSKLVAADHGPDDASGISVALSATVGIVGGIGSDAAGVLAGSACIFELDCTPPAGAGDLNCDGAINFFDIDPFVTALFSPSQYGSLYPDCDIQLADMNGDTFIDFFDIDPFVTCLFGTCS